MKSPRSATTKDIKNYRRVLREANAKLGIKTKFILKPSYSWFFDLTSNNRGKFFRIYTPPFSAYHIPTFIHYLCHAKIIEEGWPMPITSTRGFTADAFSFQDRENIAARLDALDNRAKRNLIWSWLNRALDSFFDMFVWRLVREVFGPDYLLQYTRDILRSSDKKIIAAHKKMYRLTTFKYNAYVSTIDWFVLFPLMLELVNPALAATLEEKFNRLARRKEFLEANVPDIRQRIIRLRKFYRDIFTKYPTYRQLLRNKAQLKKLYLHYFSLVWSGTGLSTRITGFY